LLSQDCFARHFSGYLAHAVEHAFVLPRASLRANVIDVASGSIASNASKRCTTTCATWTGRGRFFVDKLDFVEVGTAASSSNRKDGSARTAFRAGDALFVIHQPVGEGGPRLALPAQAPGGRGHRLFDVDDIDRAFALLDERGGTFHHRRAALHGRRGHAGDVPRITTPSATRPSASWSGAATARCSPAFVATPVPSERATASGSSASTT
jgi:hypothetical protein